MAVLCSVAAQAGDRNATHYPIVLSHHWSGTAEVSFLGDDWVDDDFRAWGVKLALESEGAIVYQPDKVPYASHETRGRLLYRKCAGDTLAEQLCEGPDPQTIDGVEAAMMDYCGDQSKWGIDYQTYENCIEQIKINIVCHSQGCPDSRYMISAMTNRLTGHPMYEHVASWTSIAGANNGTSLADLALSMVDDCDDPECLGPDFVEAMLEETGVKENGIWVPRGYESLVALSRKYMTKTMDISCNPLCRTCPKSFNEAFPNHPSVYYQTYSGAIRWLHPCYEDMEQTWLILMLLEGENDGWISVKSQAFLSAGSSPDAPPTYVAYRGNVTGESILWWLCHPGISHMGFNNARVPGMGQVDCGGSPNNQDAFYFSREGFYQDVVEDLKNMGF